MKTAFTEIINRIEFNNIHVNEKTIEEVYGYILDYQTEENDFPLWLVLRELGGENFKITEPFSESVSTVVLEDYFNNYEGISHILKE